MKLQIPVKIETERLILRPYSKDDGPAYYKMSQRNKPHLERYEAENPVMSITTEEDATKLMLDFGDVWEKGNPFFIGVFLKESGTFVAQIYAGIVDQNLPEFGIGFFADVEHEGNGYVTEAVKGLIRVLFEKLHVHRIRTECDYSNLRSIRVMERCGFVKEGLIRDNKRSMDNSFTSTLLYGLLKSDFTSEK
ncbi:MAG: GNAT family N-acetyltransferase [Candidatus Thorarchaeota archaeon]